MSEENLGRIIFVNKGIYNSETQYKKLDIVTYNGEAFIAKIDTKGIIPVDGDNWQKLATKGTYVPKVTDGILQ